MPLLTRGMAEMQGSVAQARKRRSHAGEAAAAGPSRVQAEQLELSLNGPLASLPGGSYSDAGADQDISSPKRQPATSSAQARPVSRFDDEAEGVMPACSSNPLFHSRLPNRLLYFSWQLAMIQTDGLVPS